MKKYILIIILLALSVIVFYNYYQKKDGISFKFLDIDIGNIITNPMENMPSFNPLKGVSNPFRDAYKNPFK